MRKNRSIPLESPYHSPSVLSLGEIYPLEQMLRSSAPKDHHTSYRYDNLGRLIQHIHPDLSVV